MRFIFSKIGLALLLVSLAVLWLGSGIIKPLTPFTSNSKQNTQSSIPLSQDTQKDTTPAIVRWIVETFQPIATELRTSFHSWWEKEKVTLANQLLQWMTQQQQNISSEIQTQLLKMISKVLGVNSAPTQ